MIHFTVSGTAVPAIRGFANQIRMAMNNELEADAIVVIDQAHRIHRHITRTGNLNRATRYQMDKRNTAVKFYIADQRANYGKYVHDGTRYWRPDPFLFNAVRRNARRIYADMTRRVRSLIRKYKLGPV